MDIITKWKKSTSGLEIVPSNFNMEVAKTCGKKNNRRKKKNLIFIYQEKIIKPLIISFVFGKGQFENNTPGLASQNLPISKIVSDFDLIYV